MRGKILSNKVEFKTISFESSVGARGDADRIMAALYSEGWPHSYSNYIRETRTQNGALGKLSHSVSYSYNRYISWHLIAATTLSVVITIVSAPASVLLTIAAWTVNAAGVYSLVRDLTISKYNVFAYGTKVLYVQNVYQYYSGRTVKWIATVGDIGGDIELSIQ